MCKFVIFIHESRGIALATCCGDYALNPHNIILARQYYLDSCLPVFP